MAYFKWTDEYKALVKRLYEQGMSTRQVIDYFYDHYGLNVSRRSVQRYRKGATHTPVKETKIKDVQRGTEIVINKDGSRTSTTTIENMNREKAKDIDFVLRAHGFAPEDWDIVSAKSNFWQQNSIEKGLIDLCQSKITVKPRKDNSIQMAIERLTHEVKPLHVESHIDPIRKNNLIIPLADLHFGILKLNHIQDKIAELLDIISLGYKTIVIEVIGDTLHSDKINSTETVSGTILEDVNMPNAIDEGMMFMETIVTAALKHANSVYIKSVGGNHDFDMSYMFMLWVKEHFKQAKVDVNNNYRTAYLLDHVLVSIQHGDVNKRIPGQILATEHKHMWGVASTVEIHTGHLHFDKTIDENGVIIRQFSTPKPTDSWEKKNAFVGSSKLLHALVYSDDRLKVEHFI